MNYVEPACHPFLSDDVISFVTITNTLYNIKYFIDGHFGNLTATDLGPYIRELGSVDLNSERALAIPSFTSLQIITYKHAHSV